MEKIRAIIDAVAVIVGNALNFKIVKWEEAKTEAARMHAEHAASKKAYDPTLAEILDKDGKEVEQTLAMTPLRFLCDQLLQWTCILVVLFLAFQVVKLAAKVVFKFIIFALVFWAVTAVVDFFFGDRKLKDVPAPMEPSAA